MWRRTLLTVALVGACMWCLATVQQVHSDEKQQAAEKKACFEPVAPVHELMEIQGYHFKEITGRIRSRKSDPENKDEKKAKEDYKMMGRHAYVLAELANVNQYNSEKEDYSKWAQEARDLCLKLAKVAKEQDIQAVDQTARAIHAKCGECHDKYQ